MNCKKAFTLIELILAVTIIGILGLIGFISYISYLPDSRDAARLESLLDLKKSMDVFRMKNLLPLPDRKVDILVNSQLVSYQGYLSESILDYIEYQTNGKNRGKDPKDGVYYTYLLAKDYKRFELMGYLENSTQVNVSYLNKTFADGVDYSNRFTVLYGDQLGVITQSGTNLPIQEVLSIKTQGFIDFTGSVVGEYKLNVKNNEKYLSNDMAYLGSKIKESLKIQDSITIGTGTTSSGCASTITDINGISNALSQSITVNWTRSATPGVCTWDCKSGYTWNGSTCINSRTFYCDAKPSIGTEWNTVSTYNQTWNGTSWTPADSVTSHNDVSSTTACNYKCASGYAWNGTTCSSTTQVASCTGLPSNATWNTVNSITQSWNGTNWTPSSVGAYNINSSTTECRFKCNTNYTWNGTSCIPDTRVFLCSIKPSNSDWNTVSGYVQTWNGSAFLPTDDTTTDYNLTGDTQSCRFKCSSGFTWTGTACLPPVNGPCTGLPTNSVYYGDSTSYTLVDAANGTSLTANYNATPTQNTCQYKCNSSSYWGGSSCLTYVNGACTSLPANAWYYNNTTSYTLVDAPNGTTLNALTAGYSATPTTNTCQYKCNSSSYWGGSSCLTYVNGACTSLPANAWYYNNTTSYSLVNAPNGTTLSATTAGYSAAPTTNTCQYKCNSSSYWGGSSCLTYVNGACTSLPANARYYNNTTSYSLVNAPNGTTLSAATAGYSATPTTNTCQYKCSGAGGIYWNGSSCVTQWLGDSVNGFTFKNTSGVSVYPTSCDNLLSNTQFKVGTTSPWNGTKFVDGIYYIDSDGAGAGTPFKVYCDMTTDGGGWTMVIAQFEGDPVTNWNEGIQADYDPTLATSKGFALNTTQIPSHNQIGLGKDKTATFVDYVNGKYTTGDIALTTVKSPKTGSFYQLHRNVANLYGYHNPEEALTTSAIRQNTLTCDKVGGRLLTWAFSAMQTTASARGYSLGGVNYQTTSETFAWTIWVRNTIGSFLVGDNGGYHYGDGTYATSCYAYRTSTSYANEGNGIYWIDPDGAGAILPFQVYCDMTTGGGGRTLTMKLSSSSVFGYSSAYWTTNNTLNPTDLAISSNTDAKYQSFYTVAGSTIKLCIDNSGIKCVDKTYSGKLSDYVVLTNDSQIGYTSGATTAQTNADTFISTLGLTSQGPIYCNGNTTYSYLRIGVVKNNSTAEGCSSNDYLWGFGGYNSYNGLTVGAGYLDSWSVRSQYQGFIYIK